MNGWTFIVLGALLLAAGTILGTHGWNLLKKREEAFALSVAPSLEFTTSFNTDQSQQILLRNTGQHDLSDVRICPVSYRLKGLEIEQRSAPSNAIPIADKIAVQQAVDVPVEKVVFMPDIWLQEDSQAVTAFVVIYKRKDDNKRFVNVEPYFTSKIDNKISLMALYGDRQTGIGGPPDKIAALLRKIVEMERLFFRAD